jgi:hypothetical protein
MSSIMRRASSKTEVHARKCMYSTSRKYKRIIEVAVPPQCHGERIDYPHIPISVAQARLHAVFNVPHRAVAPVEFLSCNILRRLLATAMHQSACLLRMFGC